jgi:histidine kinase
LGRGSVFWVEVPLSQAALPQTLSHQAAETTAASGQAAPLQGASAWCIGQAAIQGTAPLLQRWGCQVAQHADAEAALAQARNGPTPWPAFVVVDAAHASPATIRALLACGPKTPGVVWLSTDAGHQDAASQQASAWGWGVLTQPARPAALRALVGQLLLRAGNTTQQTEGLRLRLGVKPQAVQ